MSTIKSRHDDAVRIIGGSATAPLVLTCEHASERLPGSYEWPAADRWLRGTHWAYDLGAAELVSELAARLGAPAVLARFSRLLIDPNRPSDSPTLFRLEAEGRPVWLNQDLSPAEQNHRLARYWQAYHDAVDAVVGASRAAVVLAVHSFTPVYEGQKRQLELGVLFDLEEELGQKLAGRLRGQGWLVDLNEPYSGRRGLIYSAHHHAVAHGRRALEIEARQDLLVQPSFRARLVDVLGAMPWPAG